MLEQLSLNKVAIAPAPVDEDPGLALSPLALPRRVAAQETRPDPRPELARLGLSAVRLPDETRRARFACLGAFDLLHAALSELARSTPDMEELAMLVNDESARADGFRAEGAGQIGRLYHRRIPSRTYFGATVHPPRPSIFALAGTVTHG